MVETSSLVMRTRLKILLLAIFILETSNSSAQYLTTLLGVGNGQNEFVHQVEIDSKGNRYILGTFEDSVDVIPGTQVLGTPNQEHAFLAKLNENNDLEWIQLLKTTGFSDWKLKLNSFNDLVVAYSLTGDIIINDSLVTSLSGNLDIVVLKFSNDGNLLWCNRMGGTWFEYFVDLQLDQNDNIYICGNFRNPFDADPSGNEVVVYGSGLSSVFVQKFNTNGSMLWVKAISGEEVQVRDLALDNSGGVYLLGIFHDSIDINPDLLIENPMDQASIGSYDGYILKLTTDGIFDYAHNIGPISDYFKIHLALNSINEVFIIGNGYMNNLYNLDSEGNINLIREIGKPNKMQIRELIIDSSDNFYITGWFRDSVELVYAFQQEWVLSHGGPDGFLQKMNKSAQLIWAKQMGGYWTDQFNDLEIGSNHELITCGYFSQKALFDDENLTYLTTVPEWSQQDAFVAVYHQHECTSWECEIELYPNPTLGIFKIKSSQPFIKSTIKVLDVTGRIIVELDDVIGDEVSIDISSANHGIYYVFAEVGNEWKSYKILKI